MADLSVLQNPPQFFKGDGLFVGACRTLLFQAFYRLLVQVCVLKVVKRFLQVGTLLQHIFVKGFYIFHKLKASHVRQFVAENQTFYRLQRLLLRFVSHHLALNDFLNQVQGLLAFFKYFRLLFFTYRLNVCPQNLHVQPFTFNCYEKYIISFILLRQTYRY